MPRVKAAALASAIVILAGCLAAAGQQAPPAGAAEKLYVVDQNHPKASDENPGTPEAPWKTIGKAAATVRAGQTVYVMEGSYPEQIKVAHSGAEGKPIVFKGLPRHKAKVGVDAKGSVAFSTAKCNYLSLEGFLVVDGDIGVKIESDHVSVVDNRFENVKSVAVYNTTTTETDKAVCVYVAFNEIYRCGKGLVFGGSNWVVERNEVNRLISYGRGDCDYTRPFGANQVLRWNYFHGTEIKEVAGSHVDGFQVFDNNNELAHDILIEENVVCEFHQGLMMETYYHPGNIKNWTFRRNLFFHHPEFKSWGFWGLCGACENLVANGNTFIGTNSGGGSLNVRFDNNLFYGCLYSFDVKKHKNCTGQGNLIYYRGKEIDPKGLSHNPTDYSKGVLNKDPLLQNLSGSNLRLKKGSPAIGAGVNGVTIGALEYPNVYYVDARHPGSSDEGFGYPGAPLKTVAKALAMAEKGETIVLRDGVYRELVKPTKAGVILRPMKGEKVIITGADEISGWKRDGDRWAAPLAAKPTKVLKDGKPFAEFTYDDGAKSIVVSGFDPRVHLMETVVRPNAIDLSAAPGTKIEAIDTVNTLGEAVTGKARSRPVPGT